MTTTPGGLQGLEDFVAAADSRLDGSPLVVMLDVDGTLAPIAPTPGAASVPSATRETLRRLVALPGVHVALVSGRSAADAWKLAGVDGAWVVGNHGFEVRTPLGDITAMEPARRYEAAIADAVRRLAPLEPAIPGVLLEDKRWTLSLHYRAADPASVAQMRQRASEVAGSLGLLLTEGKKIIELRPPIEVNKGTATVALAERIGALQESGSAMYAGDDRTDEDAFRALRKRNARALTVHVRGDDPGSDATDAELTLGSTEDLRAALDWIVARRARRARPSG